MTFDLSRFVTLSWFLAAGACGQAATIQPHDMSVAQHEAAAAEEDREAAQHGAQHDPGAHERRARCSGINPHECRTDTANPTEAQIQTAERHRELAAQHRAASEALRDAEARACAGLTAEDRDMSPFAPGADIAGVSLLREETSVGRFMAKRDAGATIVVRATPGLTAEWLQRIVDCHLARNAAVGHDMPEMSYCPLVPRGAQAIVRSAGGGFAVDVRADDRAAAAEIWRRAQQLGTVR